MLDWDDLRHFLAIARHRTLSGAARALHVQQSTMGRRLDALQARAGATLLQKTPSGYTLTPAGESVLAHAERMEAEALAAERAVTGRDVRLAGLVRLTTVETLLVEVLTPILAEFCERYPDITVDVLVDVRILSLSRREADVALRLTRPEGNELVARRVGSVGYALYASEVLPRPPWPPRRGRGLPRASRHPPRRGSDAHPYVRLGHTSDARGRRCSPHQQLSRSGGGDRGRHRSGRPASLSCTALQSHPHRGGARAGT